MKIKDFYSKGINELNGKLNVYLCGPTTYSSPHIGNIRPLLVFDVLNRVASLKNKFFFVHNITDIDDKIITRSKELGITEKELSSKYEKEYLDIINSLNIIKPNKMPKVTDNISGIIKYINLLIKKGFAYEVNGSVYFNIKSVEKYGYQVNLILGQLESEDLNKDKINTLDFALWKKTDEGLNFKSPWGYGRPGWHTECSYFIEKYFNSQTISIHGGGIDLRFPHHLNEMTQFESINNKPLSMNWIYIGHVNTNNEKMSKSLSNFFSANDFISTYGPNVLRMLLISIDYSKPMDINENTILNAEKSIDKIKNSIIKSMVLLSDEKINFNKKPNKEFVEILEDNLNFSDAFTYIFKLIKILNISKENKERKNIVEDIIANMKLLGFNFINNFNNLQKDILLARDNNDYQKLDELKKEVFI